MKEKILPILMLLGIAYAGISTWKKTQALQKLHRDLPEEGRLKLEQAYPLLKHNGKPLTAISWLSGLLGVALFIWVLLKMVVTL